MSGYVIIGSGVAGISAVEAIRNLDRVGKITLIGDEPHGYYSRPGLAYYLTGELTEEYLWPFSQADFKKLGVLHINGHVAKIDPEGHRIFFDDGKEVSYDRLLIAVGASAARPNLPGLELKGVIKLDNFEDARNIVHLARRTRSAVVVGGGITALEIVEGLRARGVKTHFLLRGNKYWSNVLDDVESQIILHRLKEEGVNIHLNTEIASILDKRGRVSGVLTKDGRRIPCNMVAFAIGIRPRKRLAEEAGIRTNKGILVDEHLRSSAPDVFAAGDVAEVYDPVMGKWVIDSLWGPAREQGNIAGKNMAGENTAYSKPIPFNVTRLANLTTTIIGTVGRGKDPDLVGIARGDSETWRQLPDAIAAQSDFDVNRLRILVGQKRLLGAILMGDQTLSRALHFLILHQIDITPIRTLLLKPGAPLADILADFWIHVNKEYAL